MNILNIEHIHKVYGDKVILDDISCGVHEGDKIGIIGQNGTGKTTLLKMIAGEEEPDEGQLVMQNHVKISYLPQNQDFPEDEQVLSYVMSGQNGEVWDIESEAKSMLNHLKITDHNALMGHMSGGQRKRAALARTLLERCDILVLDEPTNHLDEEMVTWLETYLIQYKGVVIMVTHDRYFLDQTVNKILELNQGNLYAYQANYSEFLEMKAQREEMETASARKRQSLLRIELDWAKRGCRARSTKQKARLERLEALKNGKVPVSMQTVELDSPETRMGKKTIELHQISKSYGDKKLIEKFEYIFLKNQKIGIIGPNGCGKSTLIRMIAGLDEPDSGYAEMGETIKIGYFAQEEQDMDNSKRVIDYVKDIAEYIPTGDGRISASQMLERFLFTPDMQYTPIGKLSGGEKRRLYLLGVLADGINVILLDEPGNNLDIPTLTILEDYLDSFPGIVITVSHDRYFMDNVADRILAFEGNGQIRQYEGGYTDYLEAKRQEEPGIPDKEIGKKSKNKEWKQNKPVTLKFTYKEQKEYETIDEDIARLEEQIEKCVRDMTANATHFIKLNELSTEKEQAESELEIKMERWIYLNDLAEKIEEDLKGEQNGK